MEIEFGVMSKNDQLNELFSEWRDALGVEADRFIADGIIHEPTYMAAPIKLLFLGKEPHDKADGGWDFRKEWPKDPAWKHAQQIKRWSYGMLNGFPAWEEASAPPENTLLKVATMNVKKTGGGASSVYEEIEHHAIHHQEFIRRQVGIIAPDIIVGGLRGYGLWSILLGDKPAVNTVEGIGVFRWGAAKVIDFYHPSNYYPHSMSYALLSRVVGSGKFKAL